MAHPRKEIRDAAAALLVAANTLASTRVFTTRVVPWASTKLPAIAVYTGTDVVDPESKDRYPREYRRNVEMTVEIAVIHSDALSAEDALDAIEVQVLKALGVDTTFGRECVDSILATSEPEFWSEGERVFGCLKMQFDAFYDQPVPGPDDVAPLDDFALAGVTHQMSRLEDSEDVDQANDLLVIETEE